ncbi:MAG: hypothetical protein MUF40_00640, partial [Gemmatimonadaceae bacterium]|nr:hypothetical protein [Gemmatimonadaceae bacterium]
GEELSLFVLTDGTTALPLPAAQDHKRIGEGDTGPNTGGMGAYCPADAGDPAFTPRAGGATPPGIAHVVETIIAPTLAAMRARGIPFTGLLYCGLMLTPAGPKVVEFNCRFGDPETQAVLLALGDESSLVEAMLAIGRGEPLPPQSARTGDAMTLPADTPDVVVFHAGTVRRDDGTLVTAGGRVVAATAAGPTLGAAQRASQAAAAAVHFDGAARAGTGCRSFLRPRRSRAISTRRSAGSRSRRSRSRAPTRPIPTT